MISRFSLPDGIDESAQNQLKVLFITFPSGSAGYPDKHLMNPSRGDAWQN
ncbi:hypothetical protein HMPREF0578_0161 [Mobiluncus mulieris 28-1]|uniref:Uncharacterized protein n=2 Tax=Mobiluncus mulieris TaxID=2052 RepID=E0QR19_9ACTO|nr:hypothetical protein HMPREF0577_0718 [Mobiluncus mulieris ATCC 35243]EEZ90256.1 hypothetical protein HMPREF0578_0161 [Mobiluncus mulieris 28-1]EFM46012.1 hypothetical protein HMPREF0580_1334 [Mobiluncus mulieris ATCC 35239]MCU9970051.1 exodeoxyribonuclease III [Mobiluncus mulieris]MCU9974510.1 exodeoxyribonuclease III [Mobiluncus mulieris]